MRKYILVGIFGIAGAVCRFGIGLLFDVTFPWGTLIVNLAGCFLLPVIFVCVRETCNFSSDIITAMGTGFVGAFTTFSTFSNEVVRLMNAGEMAMASIYLFTSLAGGLIMAAFSLEMSNFVVDKLIKKEE